jgi:hypothetical protein
MALPRELLTAHQQACFTRQSGETETLVAIQPSRTFSPQNQKIEGDTRVFSFAPGPLPAAAVCELVPAAASSSLAPSFALHSPGRRSAAAGAQQGIEQCCKILDGTLPHQGPIFLTTSHSSMVAVITSTNKYT